jgi:thymidylate synthase
MIHVIEEKNFGNAWYKAIQNVLKEKRRIVFGVDKKVAYDSCQVIELTGNAIKQILNKETHPQYTFKAIDSYMREFTYEYLAEYERKTGNEKFDYLYMERLTERASNELEEMGKSIEEQKLLKTSSNYCQAITWKRCEDGTNKRASPCLQRIWCRWNEGDKVDLHLEWRSRDLYNAWQANLIALVGMINREVIEPNGCKLDALVDFSDSLHIYEADMEQARRIQITQWPYI